MPDQSFRRERTEQDYADMMLAIRLVESGRAREARKRGGETLFDVATFVGVTHGTVVHWERGIRIPRPDHAVLYGRKLRELGGDVCASQLVGAAA